MKNSEYRYSHYRSDLKMIQYHVNRLNRKIVELEGFSPEEKEQIQSIVDVVEQLMAKMGGL